jgi:hypothetical protein
MFPEEEQLLYPILIHYLNQPIDAILSGEMLKATKITRTASLKFILQKKKTPEFIISIEKEAIKAHFLIEDCNLVKGDISPDDHKRIKAFYADPKSQVILKKVWLSK